jgi:hypothetical protein
MEQSCKIGGAKKKPIIIEPVSDKTNSQKREVQKTTLTK